MYLYIYKYVWYASWVITYYLPKPEGSIYSWDPVVGMIRDREGFDQVHLVTVAKFSVI